MTFEKGIINGTHYSHTSTLSCTMNTLITICGHFLSLVCPLWVCSSGCVGKVLIFLKMFLGEVIRLWMDLTTYYMRQICTFNGLHHYLWACVNHCFVTKALCRSGHVWSALFPCLFLWASYLFVTWKWRYRCPSLSVLLFLLGPFRVPSLLQKKQYPPARRRKNVFTCILKTFGFFPWKSLHPTPNSWKKLDTNK